MTFITYVFLGLCLPMVAMCAGGGEGDYECCFPGKFVLKLATEATRQEPGSERTLYIDTDEKWALEKNRPTSFTLYDLRSNTSYSFDYRNIHKGCRTSAISLSDDIYRYLCIDKNAIQRHGSNRLTYQFRVLVGEFGEMTQVYRAKENHAGSGECIPVSAQFVQMSSPTSTVVTYLGQEDLDQFYPKFQRV